MNKINLVFFSSGETEQSGKLNCLINELNKYGYNCNYWRNLFKDAHDSNNIALLPMLIKKIPTFDFAIIICEGHDKTYIKRQEVKEVYTMRDNVLFEIGLSTMALGLTHIILVTDELVHIPDDLKGINQLAVERIIFKSIDDLSKVAVKIDNYIKTKEQELSPVIIGAAANTACGYLENFILRILEHMNKGFVLDNATPCLFKPEKVFINVILPLKFQKDTPNNAKKICRDKHYKKGKIIDAGGRDVLFNYQLIDDELHIYDFPTTLVTSYNTAKSILSLSADDEKDEYAERRFIDKEMKLFAYTLKSMLINEAFIKDSLECNLKESCSSTDKATIFNQIDSFIKNQHLIIERIDY